MGGLFSNCSSSSSQPQGSQPQPQPTAQYQDQDANSSVLIFHSKDTWNSKWQTLKASNKLVRNMYLHSF